MSKRYQIDCAARNRSGEVDLASATKIDCAIGALMLVDYQIDCAARNRSGEVDLARATKSIALRAIGAVKLI